MPCFFGKGNPDMIQDSSIEQFLEALASQSPTPGGGSVAAITAAMGAALVSMAELEADMHRTLDAATGLRTRLLELVEADVAVFDQVMAAYRLPRASEAERQNRSEVIQAALRAATEVPLTCAGLCLEIMRLSEWIAANGNAGVITDAGAAALTAYAALRSSELNVRINTKNLKDQAFASTCLGQLAGMLAEADRLQPVIFNTVLQRL
jgi:formiminotetrahydrofolate cyclodeaminase